MTRMARGLALLGVLAMSPAATAEEPPKGGRGFGLDLALALPVGEFRHTNIYGYKLELGPGVGALLRYADAANPSLDLTLRAGVIQHFEGETRGLFGSTTKTRFRQFPVLAGLRADLAEKVFLSIEGGLFNSQTDSRWSHDFGLVFGLGVRITTVDFIFGVQSLDAEHALDSIMVGLTLGVNFPRF